MTSSYFLQHGKTKKCNLAKMYQDSSDSAAYSQEDYETGFDDESDEDTENASEIDMDTSEKHTDIREQVYQDKLASLEKQLGQLKDGTHAEYNRRAKLLETEYEERLQLNIVYKDHLSELVERQYILDKEAAVKEFEEMKSDLKKKLIADMEEKRKLIELNRYCMELTGNSTEVCNVKPVMTRKLRRRPNNLVPEKVEKRAKSPQSAQMNYLLDEKEIENDLRAISRGNVLTTVRKPEYHHAPVNVTNQHIATVTNDTPLNLIEARIEDGKLLYERKWFHRGQPVYVEGKDIPQFSANIIGIGTEAIWVKTVSDDSKVRIDTLQLCKGIISIKRRAA